MFTRPGIFPTYVAAAQWPTAKLCPEAVHPSEPESPGWPEVIRPISRKSQTEHGLFPSPNISQYWVYIYIIQVNSVNSWLYIYIHIHNHTMNNPWNHHFFWLFYRLFYEKNPLWHRRKAQEPLVPRWWEGSPSPCRSGADPWWYLVKQCHKQSPKSPFSQAGCLSLFYPHYLYIYIHIHIDLYSTSWYIILYEYMILYVCRYIWVFLCITCYI